MKDVALVKQQDDTGCGIACVAMCLKENYDNSKARFAVLLNWGSQKKNFYTRLPEISRVLDAAQVNYSTKKSSSWEDVQGTCIVGVNREGRHWHWVVVIKDNVRFLVLDPETGEIFQHAERQEEFLHSERASTYFSFGNAAIVVHI